MVQPVKELTTFSPARSPLPLSFPHSLTRLSYSSPLTQAWPAHPPPCTQARPPLPARSCIAASRSLSFFTPERGARVRALASTLHVSSRFRIRLDDPDCLASHTRTRAASLRPHISLHSNNTPSPTRCPPSQYPPPGAPTPPSPSVPPHLRLERLSTHRRAVTAQIARLNLRYRSPRSVPRPRVWHGRVAVQMPGHIVGALVMGPRDT